MTAEDDDIDHIARELRSYGRRKGRKATPRQAKLLREVLPRVSVDLSAPSGRLPGGESEGAMKGLPSGRLPGGGSTHANNGPASGGRLPGGESPGAIKKVKAPQ